MTTSSSPVTREAVATHEAAHAVVAVVESLPVLWTTISASPEAGELGAFGVFVPNMPQDRRTCLSYARAFMAGAAAEVKHTRRNLYQPPDDRDLVAAWEWCSKACHSWEDPDALLHEIGRQAVRLVGRPDVWAAIKRVAEALLEHETLSGLDVRQLVEESRESRRTTPTNRRLVRQAR